MKEYLPTIAALFAGVVVHIFKKAATMKASDAAFSLKDYLMGHPYQTVSMFGAAAGAYLTLQATGSLTLSAAFLAGIAANSLSDAAPGSR
jgi:hypothetical protein